MTRLVSKVLLLFSLQLVCYAQMSYSNSGSATGYSIVNNVPNCGADSCWHSPPQQTNYAFFAVSVGEDGYACGITSARAIMCHTEYPGNAWSSPPAQLSGVYGIAVGDQSDIWALSGSCPNGYLTWQLSGSSWIQRGGCGTAISVDEADGLVYVINSQNNAYVSSNSGASWTQLPSSGTQIASAPGLSALVGTDGNVYVSTASASTGWAAASCGSTGPGGVLFTSVAIDQQGTLYSVGEDANVYYCGQSWSTSTWNMLELPVPGKSEAVAALSVSTVGPMTTWAVINTYKSGAVNVPQHRTCIACLNMACGTAQP
jgi:hypothetical protein